MNPLEQQIQDLENRVKQLESNQGVNLVNSVLDILVKEAVDVTDTDVDKSQTVAVSGGGGGNVTFATLDYPDRWLVVRYGGELYRLAAYLQRLDSTR